MFVQGLFIVQLAQPPRTCVLRPPPRGGRGRVFNYLIFNKKGRLKLKFNNTYNTNTYTYNNTYNNKYKY